MSRATIRRPLRGRTAVVGLVAGALVLSACSGTDRAGSAPVSVTASTSTAATGSGQVPASSSTGTAEPAPGLARYASQKLAWSACDGDFQCARLTVPVDYAKPAGATIQLALLRLRAGGKRLGSLVINPGGPGGSGIDYARAARAVIGSGVRERYDVVGFDPRGVGESAPLACSTNAQTDQLVAADPTPDDETEVATAVTLYEQLAQRCKRGGGALLAHVGTRDAARDMDVLRAALGDRQLNYLGKSYGTYLGATYAELFPANVGRMVLDGVLDPALTSAQVSLGQAKGFEQATRAFVADCARKSSCPLGSTVDGGMQRLRGLLSDLDRNALPTGTANRPLTEGLGSLGIAVAMYDQNYWPTLRAALSAGFGGDGAPLLRLSDAYTERGADGKYANNQNTVIYAVNCLDRPPDGGLAQVRRTVSQFSAQAPTWGAFLAWSELGCSYWTAKGTNRPGPIVAAGSGPIVVVGTTRDPATPYQWAVNLSKELANGHLVTYDGDGHTAYLRGSRCVDKAVDAYLIQGTVPRAGLTCT